MNTAEPSRIDTRRRRALAGSAAVGAWLAMAHHPGHSREAGVGNSARIRVHRMASGLEHPWSLAFLPDGAMLVTERPGRLRIVAADGVLSAPISGLPAVRAQGQGGLMDVALAPDFASSRRIFLSYAKPMPQGACTAAARASLSGDGRSLTDVAVIFEQQPAVGGGAHFGSRLVFARDGTLFVTLGDRWDGADGSQLLDNHFGKIVRINPDGSIPKDNPFVGRARALPDIHSYVHRNVQGAALHPDTALLWTHEHGPQGGDELNIEKPGANYGWPIITTGRQYVTGRRIGEGTERADVEAPLHQWSPSIAPSGMAFLTSERYPGWRGNLFVGGLRSQTLFRLVLDGTRVVSEHPLLKSQVGRIRDVRQGPDGLLYLLTDAPDGQLLRLDPAA
jgi:glucose/arabinose dehydrogenase